MVSSFTQRVLPLAVLAVASVSVPVLVLSPTGLPRLRNLEEERQRANEEISRLGSQITALRAEVENTVDVTITSAVELTGEQREKFVASLARRFGRNVRLHCEVDPRLIGGAVVRAGDFVIDGSLQGRLERLRSAFSA